MRWRILAVPAALSACTHLKPDFNYARRMEDGFVAPRYAHHLLRSSGGAAAYGAARMLGMGRDPAGIVAGSVSGVLPHAIGVVSGAYPFNGPDWLADGWIAGGSSLVAQTCEGKRNRLRNCLTALSVYLVGYMALAPFASP